MTNLFIGGLPFSINNQSLSDLFSKFGQVTSAQVIMDKITNKSKGFGFVEMPNDQAAQEAIKNLDGSDLEGRRLNVSVARPKEDRSRSNSGFGRKSNYSSHNNKRSFPSSDGRRSYPSNNSKRDSNRNGWR